MNTVNFDLKALLLRKRITITEMAKALNVPYITIHTIAKRGRMRLSTLRSIEAHYGDCTDFIKQAVEID